MYALPTDTNSIRITAVLVFLVGAVGCTASPSVRTADEISIRIHVDSDFHLELHNVADPETRPGKLAAEGAGAVVTATSTIPDDEAIALAEATRVYQSSD